MAYDEELAERVRELIEGEPGVVEKKMFGGLAFLVGGHMTVTASRKGGLMLHVDPATAEEMLREPGVEPYEMRGRELDGWLHITGAALQELPRWVTAGFAHARSLPPKRSAPRSARPGRR